MFLKSKHIYLRALEPTDLDFLYTLENDVTVWQVSNTTTPYARYILEQYLEHATADIYTIKQLRLLICSHQHQTLGAIDIYDFEPTHRRAGLGIIIARPFRKQQVATEALELLTHYCREKLLLHQVYCSIITTNIASLRLFEKAAFVPVGTRKEWLRTADGWLDTMEMQKIL